MWKKKEKLKPVLDENTTKLLNLKVLQRIDPCVHEIVAAATHVAIYQFNADTEEWSRKNVEGSLFVVKRNTQPRFQFTVMNRLSTDNLVESLMGDFLYEVNGPYLLYKNHSGEVNGIWFYNVKECGEIGNLFGRILDEYSEVPTKPNVSSIKSEVEKDASPEPSSVASSNAADVVDDRSSVRISSEVGTSPQVAVSVQPCQSSTALASAPPPPESIALDTSLSAPAPVSSPCTLKPSTAEHTEPKVVNNSTADLVKPSSFTSPRPPSPPAMSPITSFVPPASPLISPGNLKRPYGLLLPPFPPPPSSQSLTPTSVPSPTYGPFISREKVRKVLQLLVQDNQFIDIVYRAVVNAPEE